MKYQNACSGKLVWKKGYGPVVKLTTECRMNPFLTFISFISLEAFATCVSVLGQITSYVCVCYWGLIRKGSIS